MASPPTDQWEWDADKMLQLYLHDYMVKKGMNNTAEIFKKEAEVPNNNPVVVDSPDGFLHEWWSVFYEFFTSKQRKEQETEPGSSSNVVPKTTDDARNNAPHIPQISMSEQRSQQFQASSSFNKKMAQQLFCLIPSTINPPQDVGKQALKQEDNGIDMYLERGIPWDPPNVMRKMTIPLGGPHETKTNETLNLAPRNGRPINVESSINITFTNTKLPTTMSCARKTNQNTVLAQVLTCTPKNPTSTIIGNSTKCNDQYMKIPNIEPSDKDNQIINQMTTIVEHQHQHDKQIQTQSQNIKKSKKKKTSISLKLGKSTQNYMDAADVKLENENVEAFLSLENEHVDHEVKPFSNLKRISTTYSEIKGFSFEEVGCLHSSKNKVLASHFSSNGKVLVSAGHEKKVFIWNMETFDCTTTAEAHSLLVTDIRFKPNSTIFATSSFDRSLRLWDATKSTKSLCKLTGHAEQVMSLDFHPRKVDLLCSCDSNDVIRLWNVNERVCMHITKGGTKQVRFQPYFGKYLAAATGNNVKIGDLETDSHLYHLKGHVKDVLSICWDKNGNYVASVSEDSARVWSVSDGKCISELHSNGNKFQSCIFHPGYLNLLIIGGYQTLELWCPTESSKTWSIPAHKGLITGLADSPEDELIASTSHDHCVKLWR